MVIENAKNFESLEFSTNIPDERANTLKNLNLFSEHLSKSPISKEKTEYIINYVLSISEVEGNYQNQKENIKNDVRNFISLSLGNTLNSHLGEFNVKKFDSDGNNKIDEKELDNYTKDLTKSIRQIVLLGGLNNFSNIHFESASKSGFSNADKYIADKVDLGEFVMGEKGDKSYIEGLIQKSGSITENELYKMQEKSFSPTSTDSWKELGILLAGEFGSGVEDVLRFLGNIPSGIVLLPRYLKYRTDINSSDINSKTIGEIKIQELVTENPSLGLLDLLGEKGIDMIKKLGDLFTSGKQGDIAKLMVTLAGLIAGGAGVLKFGLRLSRKQAIKSAKSVGYEGRLSGQGISKSTRGTLKTGEKNVTKVGTITSKIDDIVGGAGIGHLTGKFNVQTKNNSISKEQVLSNSSWLERGDLNLPNKILKNMGLNELTPDQLKVVEKVHTDISKGVYKNDKSDLLSMTRVLREAGITKEQVRILMENGITGEFKFDDVFFTEVSKIESQIAKSNFQDYLDGFSGKELSLEQITVVINEDFKRFSNIKELNDFLDLYDIKLVSDELFSLAKKGVDNILLKSLLNDPKTITLDNLKYFQGLDINFDNLFSTFVEKGEKTVVNSFFEKINNSNLDFNLIKITIKSIDSILKSTNIDKTQLSKFIYSLVNKKIGDDILKILKKYLDKNGRELFTSELLGKVNSLIDVRLDKLNPKNIIKAYLDGIDIDFSISELSKKDSSARLNWNNEFMNNMESRFIMIYRGKKEFFHDINIDTFFNLNFSSLSKREQGLLYDLVKEGGEYYEKIKDFKQYEAILEQAKIASKPTK
ncbi:MAG: hypothetical protein PHV23_02525 [Candidatus Gracilibacteria bacterium]|nr:hypothetical protein [Candidatus Gracilibacteria bacterium]